MRARQIKLAREEETSLISLYAKAEENRTSDSLLHDEFAARAVNELDYDFAKLQVDRDSIVGLAVRAKIFDGWTREFVSAHPDALVLNLGCGFDSRIFRTDPPRSVYWCEIDFPKVIALRRQLYPRRRGCHLLGTSVTEGTWLRRLPADRPTLIIAEGLLLYLEEQEVQRLLKQLTAHFAHGELAFDGYSRLSLQLLEATPMIQATGALLHWGLDDPHELETQIPRLRLVEEVTRFDPGQIARLTWFARLAISIREVVPALDNSCTLLRFRFG